MEGGGALASGGALLGEPKEGLARELSPHLLVPQAPACSPGCVDEGTGGSMSMRGRGQCGDAKRLPATCYDTEKTGVLVAAWQFVRRPIRRLDLAWRAAGGGGAVVEVVEKGEKKKYKEEERTYMWIPRVS